MFIRTPVAILALLTLAGPGFAQAAEATHRFVPIAREPAGTVFGDAGAVTRAGDRAVMLVMFVPPEAKRAGYDYATTDIAYDCAGRTTQILNARAYSPRGLKLRSDDKAEAVKPLHPDDSLQNAGFALACALPAAPGDPAFGSVREAVDWARTPR